MNLMISAHGDSIMMDNNSLTLASQSPRRKEILEQFKFNVTVTVPQKVIELSYNDHPHIKPADIVISNAKRKALSIENESDCILAADTIVFYNDTEFGKPRNLDEAYSFLNTLKGQTHTVFTGFCIKKNDQVYTDYDESFVTFKNLSSHEIKSYINDYHVLDKAGAYAIQSGGDQIIEHLKGSYYNVMGLPIEKIIKIIPDFL